MDIDKQRELEAIAGTGFMLTLSEAMRDLRERGYTINFSISGDNLVGQDGRIKVDARDFVVDDVERFEESSDPDDQSILYAVSIPGTDLKGLMVESYGTYNEGIGERMAARLREHQN